MPFSIKQVDITIAKYQTKKTRATEQKEKLDKEIEECDNKIKKLTTLKKKYELLENDFTSALNE